MSTRDYSSAQVCTVRAGSKLYDFPGGLAIGTVDPPLVRDYLGRDPSGAYALISSELDGKSRTAWVSAKAVSKVRPGPVSSPDCTDAVVSERERVKAAVVAAVEAM